MRNLTDEDVKAIVEAMQSGNHQQPCRFAQISPEAIEESVKFYQNFNRILEESGSVIWKTILVSGVGGLIVIIGMGIVAKIKQITGP